MVARSDQETQQPPNECQIGRFDRLLQAVQQEHYHCLDALKKEHHHVDGTSTRKADTDNDDGSQAIYPKITTSYSFTAIDASLASNTDTSNTLDSSLITIAPRVDNGKGVEPESREQIRASMQQDTTQLWPVWRNVESPKMSKVDSQLATILEKSFKYGQGKVQEDFMQYLSGSKIMNFQPSLFRQIGCTLPLTPESKFKIAWDIVGMIALLYDMYTIPLQVFDIEDVGFFVTCGWCILVYWTLDIFLSFFSGFYDKEGEVVISWTAIARRYIRTWLLPDLLIVGIEWCFVLIKAYMGSIASNAAAYARMSKFMRIARILRTVRMMRIAKLKDIIYGLQHRMDSEWMSIAWGLASNVFILVTLNHATACGWVLMGEAEFNGSSWIKYYNFQDAKRITRYLCALHWSLTLFTPASMDVHAVNDGERAYTVLNLILAMVIFASFVSSVTAGFTRLRHLEAESIKQRFILKKFLKQNAVPYGLQSRIVRYIDIARLTHKQNVAYDHVKLLSWLSGPLKIELRKELCSPHLFLHPFWFSYYRTSHPALNEVCIAACSFVSLSKGDTLFWRFSHALHMCIVMSGSLVYRRATKLPSPKHVRVCPKSYFCEPALWVNWVHHGSMKALIECDYLSIDCSKVREISAGHRDILKMAREYALRYQVDLNNAFQRFGSAWDLPLEQIDDALVTKLWTFTDAFEVIQAEEVEAQIIEWSDDEVSSESDGEGASQKPNAQRSEATKSFNQASDDETDDGDVDVLKLGVASNRRVRML